MKSPEGVSLDDQALVPVFNQSARGGGGKMTAMLASQNRLDIHYDTGITMIDPADTDQRNFTVTGAGAINADLPHANGREGDFPARQRPVLAPPERRADRRGFCRHGDYERVHRSLP